MALTKVTYSMIKDAAFDIVDYGADPTGVSSSTTAIQAALTAAHTAGGGTVYIPSGTFLINDVLTVYSNTVVSMVGTIKVSAMPTGGHESVFVTNPSGGSNIEFINPLIDLNNIVPASGILIKYNNTNVRVTGGYIRNGANSVTYSGGRGINIEGGVTPTNITISGTNISDCWEGVSLTGGTGQESSNISISNLTINYCQSAIGLSGNAPTYPHTGAYMQAVFSNISIRNCGVVTTYSRQAGIINSNRGSNVMFENIYVYNNPTYGNPDSFWRGDANNISMNNITVETNLDGSIFNFSSYQESNSFPLSSYSSLDSRFIDVKHIGNVPEVIVLPISSMYYLTNCQFDLMTDVVTSGSPINVNLSNKTDVYLKVQNKDNNAIIEGYCIDIYTFSNQFSDWTAQEINFSLSGLAKAWAVINGTTGAVTRGYNIACTRNSTGDYTIGLPKPLPTVNYAVLVDAQPVNNTAVQANIVGTKTGSSFKLNTYSGGVAADKALINIVIYY